jgi:hypothetical protein
VFLSVNWPVTSAASTAFPPSEESVETFAAAHKSPLLQTSQQVRSAIRYLFDGDTQNPPPAVLPILPRMLDARMIAQQARFTLHCPGHRVLSAPYLFRIVVPAEFKISILAELRSVGIHGEALYPDLEHIAADLAPEWGTAEMHVPGGWKGIYIKERQPDSETIEYGHVMSDYVEIRTPPVDGRRLGMSPAPTEGTDTAGTPIPPGKGA